MSPPAYLGISTVNGALCAEYATDRDSILSVPLTVPARHGARLATAGVSAAAKGVS